MAKKVFQVPVFIKVEANNPHDAADDVDHLVKSGFKRIDETPHGAYTGYIEHWIADEEDITVVGEE